LGTAVVEERDESGGSRVESPKTLQGGPVALSCRQLVPLGRLRTSAGFFQRGSDNKLRRRASIFCLGEDRVNKISFQSEFLQAGGNHFEKASSLHKWSL